MKLHLHALALGLLLAAIPAQTSYYVPSNTPSSGTCNVIPFGTTASSTTWANQVYQCMVTAADLGNAPVVRICDLGFSPCGTGDHHVDSIEIVLGQTSATTLSGTFSANLAANVQTVLSCKDHNWDLTANVWNRVGLDRDYIYIAANGANLVVQITVTGTNMAGTTGFHRDVLNRVYSYGWTGTPPTTGTVATGALKLEVVASGADVHTFGRGCLGSNSLTPTLSFTGTGQVGQAFGVNLGGAVANAGGWLSINLNRSSPALDLALIGAPGCFFYVPNAITLGIAADASGTFALNTTIPAATPVCQR
ncbi:MAG: hypothetical protein H6837_10885, partial [Planctomycetes bacterium]|nr:hypothetical protein [Planctomycetota bacterium]